MSEFLEDPESLSGNDIGGETEPDPEGPGTDEPDPGEDEYQEGTKEPGKTPGENAGDQQEETGSDQQPGYEEILERLDRLWDQEDQEDVTLLTDSIRSLVELMDADIMQSSDVYTPPDIPFEGYEAWDYPVTVDYMVDIVGFEEAFPQSAKYYASQDFLEDYQDMALECFKGVSIKDFWIVRIQEADGNIVYDSQEPEPEPEPGEDEPDDTAVQLLSHLETINTTLAEMQQADLEYYQAVYDYQKEMLEINAAEAASTIFICFGVFAILAVLLWSELFRRFK